MSRVVSVFITLLCGLTLIIPIALANSDENVTKRRPDGAVAPRVMEIGGGGRDKIQQLYSDIAQNHANRLEHRFDFYFTRLDNIITRLERRLNTLQAQGKNVTPIQVKLDAAKTKLTEAKTKGAEAIAAFKAIVPAKFSEQKTGARTARDQAQIARKLFVDTQQLLQEAVRALKEIK